MDQPQQQWGQAPAAGQGEELQPEPAAKPDILAELRAQFAAIEAEIFEVPGLSGRFKVQPLTWSELMELEGESHPSERRTAILVIRCLVFEDGTPVFEESAQTLAELIHGRHGPAMAMFFDRVSRTFDLDAAKNV